VTGVQTCALPISVLMYMVGIFFGATIGRNVDSWLTGTKEGRALEQGAREIVK